MLDSTNDSFVVKFTCNCIEQYDRFIFESVIPYIESQTQQTLKKDDLIEALTKHQAKHPIVGSSKYICPRCGFELDLSNNYCPNCGQALDWGNSYTE